MGPNLLGNAALLLAGVTQEHDDHDNNENKTLLTSFNKKHDKKKVDEINPVNKVDDDDDDDDDDVRQKRVYDGREWKIVWRNVAGMIYLHFGAVYGLCLLLSGSVKLATFVWAVVYGLTAALGVTAGAHRLWAHRAYRARWPLRLFLIALQTASFQNHVYEWVRDHRTHHKYTDTDADPHNSRRGFFFSHVGWLLVRKHKAVKELGKKVDMSDVLADPLVRAQKFLYPLWVAVLCFVVPATVPYLYWNERWWTAWYTASVFRYVLSLHITWLVNSAAHIYGTRPYDKSISPTENRTVAALALGEGWHNYHHVFPWDYKAAELPTYGYNWTLAFINLMARWGLAYDLKTVPEGMAENRAMRTGDGSRYWGWGDHDITADHRQYCEVLYPSTKTRPT